MPSDALIQYIKTAQSQGFPESAIRAVLAQNGWAAPDIENAFSTLSLVQNIPLPPTQAGQMPSPSVTPAPVSQTAARTVLSKSAEYNSPYSIGLAIIAFVSLLILVNKIIDDTATLTSGINQQLIFDALIIVPFLIMAFILHGSFSENRKRFLILSQPYFVTSGLLLVRLLWDTSRYILNASAVYGVYIVLIIVILVLTGLIIFVRKYITAQ